MTVPADLPTSATIVWSDTFSGGTSTNWVSGLAGQPTGGWPPGGPTQGGCLVDPAEMEITPSGLHVVNKLDAFTDSSGQAWQGHCGFANTYSKWSFGWGYLEIKARMPKGQGLWPCLWLLPSASGLPWPPELDILEMAGQSPNQVNQTLHYLHGGVNQQSSSVYTASEDLTLDYHRYGIRIDNNRFQWFIDDVLTKEIDYSTTPWDTITNPWYVNISTGTGATGTSVGPSNSTTPFVSSVDVEYVQLWQW